MGRGNYNMERSCEECGKIFNPPMLRSRYCCKLCVKRASKKRMIAKAKEEQRKALVQMIPDTKEYITIAEAVVLYRISRDTLYRLVIKKDIPSINLGKKMIRLNRTYMDKQFLLDPKPKPVKKATISLEPKDCYTIGQIAKKFDIDESSVFKHIRRFSIPTRQIGNYVYAPKSEINKLYKSQ